MEVEKRSWTEESGAENLGLDGLMGFLSEFRSAGRVGPGDPVRPEERAEPGEQAPDRHGVATVSQAPPYDDDPDLWLEDPYSGCDHQVGAGWWVASDGRWYPPELHPDVQAEKAPAEPDPHAAGEEEAGAPASPPVGHAARTRAPGARFALRRLRHSPATI